MDLTGVLGGIPGVGPFIRHVEEHALGADDVPNRCARGRIVGRHADCRADRLRAAWQVKHGGCGPVGDRGRDDLARRRSAPSRHRRSFQRVSPGQQGVPVAVASRKKRLGEQRSDADRRVDGRCGGLCRHRAKRDDEPSQSKGAEAEKVLLHSYAPSVVCTGSRAISLRETSSFASPARAGFALFSWLLWSTDRAPRLKGQARCRDLDECSLE